MHIKVLRDISSPRSTGSKIFVDGAYHSFALEPAWTDDKSIKPRAIDPGIYDVTRRFSPKHNGDVPHVENVPGFDEVEIHPGNFAKDTLACLLPGYVRGEDQVLSSKSAFGALDMAIASALHKGEKVTIEYVNAFIKEADGEATSTHAASRFDGAADGAPGKV